jgi:hypothetical protein
MGVSQLPFAPGFHTAPEGGKKADDDDCLPAKEKSPAEKSICLEACAREQRGRERGEMRTEMFVASRQQHTIPLYTAVVRRQFGSRRVTIELSIVLDQE